jgi:cobalt/nickel transport system permease protein
VTVRKQFSTVIAARITERSPQFSASFDRRTLPVVWLVYIVTLMSVGKYDVVRTLSFVAFPVFVIIADRLSSVDILKRIALLSPFVIIMAAANPLLDRTVHYSLGACAITGGMLSATVIACKAVLSLAMMIILDKCMSVSGLCASLRRLGVPAVFTTQLLLLHRYIFLIAAEAATMIKARDLRSCGKWGRGPFVTANLIGTLLLRCTERSERVYRSMLARGFTGTFPCANEQRFSYRDLLFAAVSFSLFILLRWVL